MEGREGVRRGEGRRTRPLFPPSPPPSLLTWLAPAGSTPYSAGPPSSSYVARRAVAAYGRAYQYRLNAWTYDATRSLNTCPGMGDS